MSAQQVPMAVSEDVVRMRQLLKQEMVTLGFSVIEQTKMITAASELARNTLRYGGGGMGLGLPGARRLADEFDIETAPGQGCRVTITKWKAF